MEETAIERRQVFSGRIFGVRVDQVRTAQGAPAYREVVTHPGSVAVVATPVPDQVYLVEQYRYAAGRGLWELPAGRLEAGEDPQETAVRELDEEVNALAENWAPLITVYSSPGFTDEVISIFHASSLQSGSGKGGDESQLRAVLWPLDEALAMIYQGEIVDAKTVAGLCCYALQTGQSRPPRASGTGARRTPGEDPGLQPAHP